MVVRGAARTAGPGRSGQPAVLAVLSVAAQGTQSVGHGRPGWQASEAAGHIGEREREREREQSSGRAAVERVDVDALSADEAGLGAPSQAALQCVAKTAAAVSKKRKGKAPWKDGRSLEERRKAYERLPIAIKRQVAPPDGLGRWPGGVSGGVRGKGRGRTQQPLFRPPWVIAQPVGS